MRFWIALAMVCASTAWGDAESAAGTASQPLIKDGSAAPTEQSLALGTAHDYFDSIQQVLMQHVRYPPRALKEQVQGVARMKVRFSREGVIEEVSPVQVTGNVALDAEARNVFARIVRFPPVPAGVAPNSKEFVLEMPITFNLPK